MNLISSQLNAVSNLFTLTNNYNSIKETIEDTTTPLLFKIKEVGTEIIHTGLKLALYESATSNALENCGLLSPATLSVEEGVLSAIGNQRFLNHYYFKTLTSPLLGSSRFVIPFTAITAIACTSNLSYKNLGKVFSKFRELGSKSTLNDTRNAVKEFAKKLFVSALVLPPLGVAYTQTKESYVDGLNMTTTLIAVSCLAASLWMADKAPSLTGEYERTGRTAKPGIYARPRTTSTIPTVSNADVFRKRT